MFDYICQISHRYIYRIYDYCQNFSRNEPVALFGTRVEEIVSVDFMEWNGRWISIMERFLEMKIKPLNNKPKNNNNNNNSKNSENNNSLKSLFSCMNRQFLANFCITIFFCKWLCLTCQRVFYKIRHASAKFLNTFD